jgi:hypothetical protein
MRLWIAGRKSEGSKGAVGNVLHQPGKRIQPIAPPRMQTSTSVGNFNVFSTEFQTKTGHCALSAALTRYDRPTQQCKVLDVEQR